MQTNNLGVIDAANELRNLLPCKFDDGILFRDGLKSVLNKYIEILSSIDSSQFNELIKKCKLNVTKLTKRRFINFALRVVDAVLGIIDTYLDGNPYESYSQFNNLFTKNKVLNRPKNGYISLSSYLDDIYGNLFSHDTTFWHTMYRIRIGKNIVADEMYHVPFDKREKVGTYRFSIPGWPAFYVGTSVDVCWEEVKRGVKEDERIYVAEFHTDEKWILFSLQIPLEFIDINDTVSPCSVYYFLCTFPIFAASLVKVRYPNDPFKPEYIVPQMILQYVKNNSLYENMGIIYSSTKCESTDRNPNLNIVIPTKKSTNYKLCDAIASKFKIKDFKEIKLDSDERTRQQLRDFQMNIRANEII